MLYTAYTTCGQINEMELMVQEFCYQSAISVSFPQVAHLASENREASHSSLIFNYVLIIITLLLTNC